MTTSTTSPSVKDRLQEMLLATKKFDPSTGELMARWADAFYTTMAARTGVSAQDLYRRFPLRVRSQDTGSRPVMAGSSAEVKPSRADRKVDKAMEAAWQGSVAQQLPPVKNVMARSRNAHLLTQEQRLYEWREVKIAAKNLPSSKRQHEMHKDKLADLRSEGWLMSHVTEKSPLLFAWDEDGYYLVDGAHRLAVAQEQNDIVTVLIGRPRSSQTSSERVTDTPEFKRWFGRSQVVDGLGRPLVLYHGTGADFTEFRTDSELGAHFGTAGQAEERAPKYSKARWGGMLVPVYLSIKNPLRLRDLGDFHPQTVAAQLIDKGIKPKSGQGFKLTSVTAGEVRAAIEEHGYDGVVYLNRTEGISPSVLDAIETEVLDGMFDDEALDLLPGAQDSYIAFRPAQIKSAIGNDGSFDGEDPNMLSQPANQRYEASSSGAAQITKPQPRPRHRPTDTPEFKRWFGGSKVVAADGHPMVVYHGTDSDFTEFRRAHIAEPEHEGGFFFTPKYDIAADFGDRVLPVYLSIRKPKVMTAAQWGEIGDSVEQLRAKGYDGIRVKDYDMSGGEDAESSTADMWVAFEPTQVKSAVHNDGSFDRDDPSVLSQPPLEAPPFQDWFKDSKVVDRDGNPLVVYHGTNQRENFSMFEPGDRGVWFTEDQEEAGDYSTWSGEHGAGQPRVMPVYLRVRNPYKPTSQERLAWRDATAADEGFEELERRLVLKAKSAGHDGIELGNGYWVAFFPEQVKSAIGNDGSFDRDDPSVLSQPPLDSKPAHRQTQTPEFKTWFADSKIVTRRGTPKRMHHGTDAAGITQFRTPTYFTASTADAQNWGENVMSAYLSIKNPVYIDDYEAFSDIDEPSARAFAAEGYDGAVHTTGRGAIHMAVAFHAEQIGAALDNDGSFDRDPSILSQSALEDSPAARSPLGLYSALAHHLASSPTRQATPAGWKQLIQGLINKGAVKADEVEWTGINDWLDLQRGKVTKEQVTACVEQGGVRVEETVLGAPGASFKTMTRAEMAAAYERIVGYDPVEEDPDITDANLREQLEGFAREAGEADGITEDGRPMPKYSQYTLPGGEHYREVLLTLADHAPDMSAITAWQTRMLYKHGPDMSRLMSEDEKSEGVALRSMVDSRQQATYQSKHWDQRNVLAHIRLNDRTDADGKRVLFIEELQSDWGQEGKKKGFREDSRQKELRAKGKALREEYEAAYQQFLRQADSLSDAEYERRLGQLHDMEYAVQAASIEGDTAMRDNAERPPVAPFVTKTEGWLNLALKRLMVMAAEGGYDKVAFVNGEQNAKRYDLSKQIDTLTVALMHGKGPALWVRGSKNGAQVINQAGIGRDRLAELIGKELAQKTLDKIDTGESASLEGLDLRVGGEGLRTFYDEVVPLTLKKLLNKLDPQSIGPVHFPGRLQIEERLLGFVIVDPQTKMYFRGGDSGRPWVEYPTNAKHFSSHTTARRSADAVDSPMGVNPSQPGFTLTPLLREKALQGLPLFQRQVQAKDATPRGTFNPRTLEIALGPKADASTWIHETGHFFLEALAELASEPNAPASVVHDMNRVLDWFGIVGTPHRKRPALPQSAQSAQPTQPPHRTALQTWMDMTLEQKRPFHEQWAGAMEQYVMEGTAPSEELRPVMEVFSAWLRAIYVSTRDFLEQAAGSLTNRTIHTSTRSSFGPSETLFRKALADQQAYTENPRAWFESRLHDVAQRLAALGVEAVMSGNGRPARFFSSDGEVPASGLTGQAGLLAKLYAQINAEYDAAETGRPPQFMPVGLDPDIELMPLTDRQRVVDLLTRGLRGELPVHASLMQAPAAPDPGPCRLTLTDDIRRVMDRLLSEQALDSCACGDEEESAATDRRERMGA